MPRISPTYIYRGMTDSSFKNRVQQLYDTVLDRMDTTPDLGLAGDNFAPNAGIPEQALVWERHAHEDGSLADNAINDSNLDTFGEGQSVQFVLTLAPGILGIVGRTRTFQASSQTTTVVDMRVYFMEASRLKAGFRPGTNPVVITSLADTGNVLFGNPTQRVYVMVRDVTSEYFDLRIRLEGVAVGSSFSVEWLAFGQAPGSVQAV